MGIDFRLRDLMRAVQDQWRHPLHAAKLRRLAKWRQECAERPVVQSGLVIGVGGAAGGDRKQIVLAAQRGAALAVGPADYQDHVDPFL